MKATQPIPEGHRTITPYLIVKGAEQAISFYQKAFHAKEILRMDGPGGGIGHAELQIGDSKLMLADEVLEMGFKGPESFGGSPVSIHLYVEDVDSFFEQAVQAGAKIMQKLEDKFYGDRAGSLEDPFGHTWHLAMHKEDLTMDEIRTRMFSTYPELKKN